MKKFRVVIIGAGIVGASIARILSMYENFDVVIVEKEPDVGWGVSKANTSIIHPGHEEDPNKYPLRAKLCVKGNQMWRTWAEELEIPVKWPGELMVFTNEDEEKQAREYIKLAQLNGVPGVRVVYGEELRFLEPSIGDDAKGAVYAPTAGVISPFEAVIAIVENAVENGAKLLTEAEVTGIRVYNSTVKGVETTQGFVEADIVINAAGLYADKISHLAGVELDFYIRPRKGEYILFDENIEPKPLKILHTVPTHITKGVYAITTVHGNVLIGPTAEDLPLEARDDASTSVKGLDYVYREATKLLKKLPPKSKIIRTFAGLRPEPPNGQWLIKAYSNPWGFVNVAGIRSPGLTAAPAIAEYVVELVANTYDVKLIRKGSWNPYRHDITRLSGKSLSEIDDLIRKNPDYGEIVCYCKMVSKAEVLEAIDRMMKIGIKTITLDGLKFRIYTGFGKCQGSFCRWRVAKVVSDKLGIPYYDVVVKKSSYGIGEIKILWSEKVGEENEVSKV